MKNVNSSTRTRLGDEHLEGCIRIATTEREPDFEKIIKPKQGQMTDLFKEHY
jgi:hypothetical protein